MTIAYEVSVQTQRHTKSLFKQSMRLLFVTLFLLSCAYVPSVFAKENCSVPSSHEYNSVVQENVILSLPEHGLVDEEIILHIDILPDAMPANAWGRVSIKINITLKDGITQKGQIQVLEGVPETTMHFTQKGLYDLTISVGYLVKST